MLYVYCWLKSLLSEDEGQDLIEYVLIAGFIALVAVAAITLTGTNVNVVWNNLATRVGAIPAG